jgi:hypothetical protein
MVRRPERTGTVGATSLAPGPQPNLPSERISGYSWTGFFIHRRTGGGFLLGRGRKGAKGSPMPFALLVILLVLAVVALLFAVYLLVRRWL